MERVVAKFGGSSVAESRQIGKVRAILEADPRRKVVVVSAPGKRQPTESKITDLLYLCHAMVAMSTDIGEPFGLIRNRFAEIAEELHLSSAVVDEIGSVRERASRRMRARLHGFTRRILLGQAYCRIPGR